MWWIYLLFFDAKTKTFTRYKANGKEDALSVDNLTNLLLDRSGTLWVGTTHGLYWLNRKRSKFIVYKNDLAAVTGLVNKINETKQVHFSLQAPDTQLQLNKENELMLYRITQELINNVFNTQRQNIFG